jgi:hypothetical protein
VDGGLNLRGKEGMSESIYGAEIIIGLVWENQDEDMVEGSKGKMIYKKSLSLGFGGPVAR